MTRTLVQPQAFFAPESPLAEVRVRGASLQVTLSLPCVREEDVDVTLTRHTLYLRHKRDPSTLHLAVPLPVIIEPERYVARPLNGVWDFTIQRATR